MTLPPLESRLPRGQTVLPRQVIVHFDGACEPPGTGGIATYGFTIDGEGFEWEGHGLAVRPHAPTATNNVAEYVAAICALEWLVSQHYNGPVLARGDSQLVVRQVNGEYEVKAEHLRAYHARVGQLRALFERVEFEWIPREENRRADALSKLALTESAPALAPRKRPRA
ncbi:MAG: ribonuclease HI family protein [Thermoplasmata archaeon]|nr:ribonuclease HI family protein [Thermoplasmata archaeon]